MADELSKHFIPRKKHWPQGRVDGMVLDVRSTAALLGMTEKALRHLIERRAVPHRRLNGKIIFVRSELEQFVMTLPGCSVEEAKQMLEKRGGRSCEP